MTWSHLNSQNSIFNKAYWLTNVLTTISILWYFWNIILILSNLK